MFVFASERGQPPHKGQNARSQFVRYSEVLLYQWHIYIAFTVASARTPHQSSGDYNLSSDVTADNWITELY